ncbi:MAG: ABC transporter ATP-binding protein [Candidatus Lokiarchaeota archaeon]|nr:ABC transporter ATP-binding protein [Candidatus Lokiarchaeota archaeon]
MESNWIICVKDLNYKYPKFELKNISFNVKKRERFALVGPNGAGKTTIFRLLVNLNKATSGIVKILGQELSKKTEWDIRKQIGYLFQNPEDQIFSPTVREEVAFGPRNLGYEEDKIESLIEHSLKHVDMYEYIDHSPSNLSWGQKKRVALASILAMEPKILLLDEPFVNLDNKSIINLFKILEKLRNGHEITILFTSHNYFFIENWADNMLVMNHGHQIFYGNPKEGLKKEEVLNAIGNLNEIEKLLNINL